MAVIDVHTHMLSERWISLLSQHGGRYTMERVPGGQRAVHVSGAPFMTLTPGMLDYELRISRMDEAGVDLAIISLTCPNVFWGSPEVSLEAARATNDEMAAAQRAWPDRIRWLASLPWQHPNLALGELKRSAARGAVGVMVLGNIAGRPPGDPAFDPVWSEIDRHGLPVLLHPTAPAGVEQLDLGAYNLVASIGFPMDTTLAVARMVMDGFFDRFPEVKLIASHGGGALPYLAGRMDQWHRSFEACRERIQRPPSDYLRNLWYDAVVYERPALDLCLKLAGRDRVLYGSDYPHNVGDMAGCLARVDSLRPATAAAVRGGNAERIFKL
jgi:aminocarboxymuconate-semialdehyde decarboxylase